MNLTSGFSIKYIQYRFVYFVFLVWDVLGETKFKEKHITRARIYIPKKRVAFKGVPLEGCT